MGIRIELETNGNAAFTEDERGETARALRQLANEIEDGHAAHSRKIYDINGNPCGRIDVSDD